MISYTYHTIYIALLYPGPGAGTHGFGLIECNRGRSTANLFQSTSKRLAMLCLRRMSSSVSPGAGCEFVSGNTGTEGLISEESRSDGSSVLPPLRRRSPPRFFVAALFCQAGRAGGGPPFPPGANAPLPIYGKEWTPSRPRLLGMTEPPRIGSS